MLTTVSLARSSFESGWAIHPFSGELLKFEEKDLHLFTGQVSSKVSKALALCDKPYCLIPKNRILITENPEIKINELNKIFSRLLKLGNNKFFMSRIYASIAANIFENSLQAMSAINSLEYGLTENRCLQKCLAVAKTSKSFKKSGVIFIGAQIPLKEMHAWIIEDEIQPDLEDRSWINFSPLMAITFN